MFPKRTCNRNRTQAIHRFRLYKFLCPLEIFSAVVIFYYRSYVKVNTLPELIFWCGGVLLRTAVAHILTFEFENTLPLRKDW